MTVIVNDWESPQRAPRAQSEDEALGMALDRLALDWLDLWDVLEGLKR